MQCEMVIVIFRDFSNNFLVALPIGGDFTDLSLSNDFSAAGNYIEDLPTGTFQRFSCDDL